MKKITYVANVRIPTEKAHGIQIMNMCEAFASLGHEVELVVPRRMNPINDDPFSYYSIEKSFRVTKLPCLDFVRLGKIGYWIEVASFASMAAIYLVFKKGTFFTREEFLGCVLGSLGKRVCWETHMGQSNVFVRFLIRMNVRMIAITESLKKLYVRMGARQENVVVIPDAVKIETFDIADTKSEARKKLGFSQTAHIVLYTGHLYSWKGAHTLGEAASLLPHDVEVYFVGGTTSDIAAFKQVMKHISQVKILGSRPHKDIPLYMRAADILVIPNSGKESISRLYASPMKLFEYMASHTPILASDVESLREILGDHEAYFAKPDDAQSLASLLVSMAKSPDEAAQKASAAFQNVQEYTWKKRAEKILAFL